MGNGESRDWQEGMHIYIVSSTTTDTYLQVEKVEARSAGLPSSVPLRITKMGTPLTVLRDRTEETKRRYTRAVKLFIEKLCSTIGGSGI